MAAIEGERPRLLELRFGSQDPSDDGATRKSATAESTPEDRDGSCLPVGLELMGRRIRHAIG